MRQLLQITIIAFLLLSQHLAEAKSSTLKKQMALNEKAIGSMIDGDYETAIEQLKQSLELGELNITYLNLGRAYAKSGRCSEALGAYDRMAVAPRVDSPTPDELYDILVQYRSELLTDCDGTVVVRCQPLDLMVSIDQGEKLVCPNAGMDLPAGEHVFEAYQGDQVVAFRKTEVVGMSSTAVDLEAAVSVVDPLAITPKNEATSVLTIMGWSATSLGAGLLLTAAIIDLALISPNIDEFDKAIADYDASRAKAVKSVIDAEKTANTVILVAGGVTLATGAGLLIYDLISSDEEPEEGFSFNLGIGSIGFTSRF